MYRVLACSLRKALKIEELEYRAFYDVSLFRFSLFLAIDWYAGKTHTGSLSLYCPGPGFSFSWGSFGDSVLVFNLQHRIFRCSFSWSKLKFGYDRALVVSSAPWLVDFPESTMCTPFRILPRGHEYSYAWFWLPLSQEMWLLMRRVYRQSIPRTRWGAPGDVCKVRCCWWCLGDGWWCGVSPTSMELKLLYFPQVTFGDDPLFVLRRYWWERLVWFLFLLDAKSTKCQTFDQCTLDDWDMRIVLSQDFICQPKVLTMPSKG